MGFLRLEWWLNEVRFGKLRGRFAQSSYGIGLVLLLFLLVGCDSEVVGTAEPEQGSGLTSEPTADTAPTDLPLTAAVSEEPTTEPNIATITVSTEVAGEPGLLTEQWRQVADMLTKRSEMAAVTLNGRIYVPGGFGGEERLEVYYPQTNSWSRLADLPEGRHHLMAAGYNGRLYVFGGARSPGWQATDTTWIYDPIIEIWSELAPMPEKRVAGAAVTLGDFIYVMGGTGGSQDLLRYDPATNSWTRLAPHLQPREHTAAVALGGNLYLLGGRWQSPGELDTIEIYDPGSNSWELGPAMIEARSGFAATVFKGQIFALGGEIIISGLETLASVEVFDSASQSWQAATAMPFPLHGVPAAVTDEALYVLGGADEAGTANNSGRTLVYRIE